MSRFVLLLLVCLCCFGWSQEAEAGPFVEPLTLLPQAAGQMASLTKLPMSGSLSGSLVDRFVLSGGSIGEVGVLQQSFATGQAFAFLFAVAFVVIAAAAVVGLIGNIVMMAGDHRPGTRMGWGIFGIVSGGLTVLSSALMIGAAFASPQLFLLVLGGLVVGAGAVVFGSLSVARAKRQMREDDGYGRGRRYRRYRRDRRRYRRDDPDGRLQGQSPGQVGSFALPGVSASSVSISF